MDGDRNNWGGQDRDISPGCLLISSSQPMFVELVMPSPSIRPTRLEPWLVLFWSLQAIETITMVRVYSWLGINTDFGKKYFFFLFLFFQSKTTASIFHNKSNTLYKGKEREKEGQSHSNQNESSLLSFTNLPKGWTAQLKDLVTKMFPMSWSLISCCA